MLRPVIIAGTGAAALALGLVIFSCSKSELSPASPPTGSTAPGAVTDPAAVDVTENSATPSWTAPGDDGSSGTAAQYEIRMSSSPITDANYAAATIVDSTLQPQPAGTQETTVIAGLTSWKE